MTTRIPARIAHWVGTRNGEPHWECIQATCDQYHQQCGAPLPAGELDVLEQAAIAGDRARVASMLAEHRSLTGNIERSALQQLDCRGNVVVHIPVPLALISDLSPGEQH